MRDGVDVLQRHHPLGEQTQCPAASSLGRLAAGQRDQVSLAVAIEFAWIRSRAGPPRQHRLEALFHELPPHPFDSGDADVQGLDDLLVLPRRLSRRRIRF